MKQMTGSHFRKEFDISKTKFYELTHSDCGFPAYKIKGTWYVDIPAYKKWREIQHINNTGGKL